MKLVEKQITVSEYNYLTESVGWGRREESVVDNALANTFYSVCICDGEKIVGYARLIGDGSIFLYVQDVMVLPAYQGKGIGTLLMNALVLQMERVKETSPTLRVYLGASRGKETFYEQFGFITRGQAELGDGMIWNR